MSRISRITRIISKEAGLNRPSAIVYDSIRKMLYICDMGSEQVVKYRIEDGKHSILPKHCANGPDLMQPLALAINQDGKPVVTDIKQNKVFQWDDLHQEWEEMTADMEDHTRFHFPGSIAVNDADEVYIADFLNHRICRRKRNGSCSKVAAIQCRKPYGICTDSEALYITDYGSKAIKRYDYKEKWCETIIEGYAAIAVSVDVNGNLYFCRERELYRWTKADSKVELLLNSKTWKQYGFERLCHIGALASMDANTLLFTDTIKNCIYELYLQE